jgi:hypothetical protein
MMAATEHSLRQEIRRLEQRLRRTQLLSVTAVAAVAALVLTGLARVEDGPADEVRTRRLVVVDDQGVPRVVIGQDPADAQRRSRAAGITIHDKHGHERGGMSTFDDGTVALALDAPMGVGSPMRDRLGLMVGANGAAAISLINNQTSVPVRIVTDESGSGGVEFIDYDLTERKAFIRRLSFDGESTREMSLGQ